MFCPLTAADLARLPRWFNAPHARRWYRDRSTPEQIAEEYLPSIAGAGAAPLRAHTVWHGGRPIGLFEWVRIGDFPAFQAACEVEDPDTANCDILIGEPSLVHRGIGPGLIKEYLRQVVFADPAITGCVIDPEPDNAIAIRAYEKVGFRFLRALPDDGEGNGVYLLGLSRQELDAQSATPAPFIRPARPHEAALGLDIDEDACELFRAHGLPLDVQDDHPLARAEIVTFQTAARCGRLLFACSPAGVPVGCAVVGYLDGHPHLFQLSVRRAWMRQGIGQLLLRRARRWSVREGALWITTYDHLPWNGPWYERLGFQRVDEAELGPEVRAQLALERTCLPAPEHRCVMKAGRDRQLLIERRDPA